LQKILQFFAKKFNNNFVKLNFYKFLPQIVSHILLYGTATNSVSENELEPEQHQFILHRILNFVLYKPVNRSRSHSRIILPTWSRSFIKIMRLCNTELNPLNTFMKRSPSLYFSELYCFHITPYNVLPLRYSAPLTPPPPRRWR
jgi:hypothetical protein